MSHSIAVSQSSIDLLRARVANGKSLAVGMRLPDGRWAIDVDDDVFSALAAIDPDADKAIAILCTTGVGHG